MIKNYYLLIGFLFVLLYACNENVNQNKEKLQTIDSLNIKKSVDNKIITKQYKTIKEGLITKLHKETPFAIDSFCNGLIQQKISNKEQIVFEIDTSFVFVRKHIYSLEDTNYKVFLIKGNYYPSEAEFDICGIFSNENKILGFDYYAMPVEIFTKFTDYKIDEYIHIYGSQEDLAEPHNAELNNSVELLKVPIVSKD